MKYAEYAMCVFRHFQYAKYAQYASIRIGQFADVQRAVLRGCSAMLRMSRWLIPPGGWRRSNNELGPEAARAVANAIAGRTSLVALNLG